MSTPGEIGAKVERLGKVLREAGAGKVHLPGRELQACVHQLGEEPALAEALAKVGSAARTPTEWAALGLLGAAIRRREFRLVVEGRVAEWEEFQAFAGTFGVEGTPARLLYAQVSDHWLRLQAEPSDRSRVETYLALHESGIMSRPALLELPSAALAQRLDVSLLHADHLRGGAFRALDARGPIEFVSTRAKRDGRRCCPPFSDPRWADRFDYFGADSRLSALVTSLKGSISDRIHQMFAALVTPAVRDAAEAFGVGDPALFDTRAAGAPFFGSGEPIQAIGDLASRTTKAEAQAWIDDIGRQLQRVRDSLRVDSIESYIWTSDKDGWGTGGGDGDQVFLWARGTAGNLANLAPPQEGGGFPIDSSNYNDGALAFAFWGSNHAYELPIPSPGGTIPALDIGGFRLEYNSTNDWYFDSAQIYFRYALNGHSRPLTEGQPVSDEWMYDDDLVHDDQGEGWVHFGDQFDFGVVPGSRLARAQGLFRLLTSTLAGVQAALSSADLSNVYLQHGDEIITALREAAVYTRQGEHTLARGRYAFILDVLSVLDPARLGAMDRELLLALHALLASSYAASGSVPQAYGHYVEAYRFTVGDAEGRAYLWHALAELLLRWGDHIYAAAGTDFAARLLALDRYRKVTDAAMNLTYEDGREDEVADLWIDLSRPDGSVPARLDRWAAELGVRTGAPGQARLGRPIPVVTAEVVADQATSHRHVLRIHLDVSETRLLRGDLDLVVSNATAALAAWQPTAARLQARLASYNPLATPIGFRGPRSDILTFAASSVQVTVARGRGSLELLFRGVATVGRNRLPAPLGCSAQLLKRRAQQRIDQIRSHLNVFGIHDEYVPSGRFQALERMALQLSERAVYFWTRYLDFFSKAEAASLDELDAAFLVELSGVNLEQARLRVTQAGLDVAAATAAAGAAGVAIGDASRVLNEFGQTYQIGLLRVMNSINLNVWPPGVGLNLGGFVGSLSGADGYDAQFHTRELEYQAAVDRATAAGEAAEFRRRLAEIESLIAEGSLTIEEMRAANVQDRLTFVRDRMLNATTWYEMARIYRELAEAKIHVAARWAWTAERALEFELNVPVSIIRMDYHLLPLGAERLRDHLDALRQTLTEFRERYRDVPNIIEREFRFSLDFPQEFRALTSQSASPPAVSLAPGVRAVEFRTAMADYDARLPGRYAFGRILGVELELQTDVATSVFSGHLENARVITGAGGSTPGRVQVSESLVRVPIPERTELPVTCPPPDDLDDAFFIAGDGKPPVDPGCFFDGKEIPQDLWDAFELPGLRWPDRAPANRADPGGSRRRRATASDSAGSRPFQAAAGVTPSLRSTEVTALRACMAKCDGFVGYLLSLDRPAIGGLPPGHRDIPEIARPLVARAVKAGLGAAQLAYLARNLFKGSPEGSPEAIRLARQEQLARWNDRLSARGMRLAPDDGDALAALGALGASLGAGDGRELTEVALAQQGRRSWARYLFREEQGPDQVVVRDLTAGHGAARTRPLDVLPDYLDYPTGETPYGLRLKRHDAESLTISAYRLRESAAVFNPYNPGDQLGVFENTGIDTTWRLTLRALPANRLNTTPQWDKIRDVVMRVYYHAAYERLEGFRLAEALEPRIIRWGASKVLSLSLYRDFYDELASLVGDFDETDPTSLAAVRSFTDESHAASGGWVEFTVDAALIPAAGQRIRAALVVFTAEEPSTFPAYVWQLRAGAAGPVVQGTSTEGPGPLCTRLSAPAPAGFGGLEVRGAWFLRLARADNPGASLGPIRDIELIFELEPN